jgi:hypothetical protein
MNVTCSAQVGFVILPVMVIIQIFFITIAIVNTTVMHTYRYYDVRVIPTGGTDRTGYYVMKEI